MQRLWTFLGFSEEDAEAAASEEEASRRRRPAVFNLHAHRPMEIVVVEPRTLEEARAAADHLKARHPVVVNLREADRELARRIVDFSCGVAYAVDGQMQKLGEEIFLFTPSTVVVTAESLHADSRDLFPMT